MSRREKIRMSDAEGAAFLTQERTVTCATLGPRGLPHLMPLWYVLREPGDGPAPRLWAWTYAASQKVRNLERDPRATIQVEAGEEYQELRGVMFKCEVELVRDTEAVSALGVEIFARYGRVTTDALDETVRAMVAKQAAKRVGLHFAERDRATWDHRKLGAGVY